jgi:hypothetical protein
VNSLFLSIVVCVRNDNYGGDFIARLQECLNWNIQLLEKHHVEAEFIMVNWNPDRTNAPLEKLITFSTQRNYVQCRIINVPEEIHQQFVDPLVRKTVPVFEFIGKNVGVKRAKGTYILCMNADILLHPEIVSIISKRQLQRQYYYRADRLDFVNHYSLSVLSKIYEAANVVSLKGFAYYFHPSMSKVVQYRVFRLFNTLRIHWELWKFRNERFCRYMGISVTYDNAAYLAHCHNSGDFMLMHKDNWLALAGYPEGTYISTHTDALFTIFAFTSLKESVFKWPVFHQNHERRYTWDAIKNEETFLEAFQNFERIAQDVVSKKISKDYLNNANWGLEGLILKEDLY